MLCSPPPVKFLPINVLVQEFREGKAGDGRPGAPPAGWIAAIIQRVSGSAGQRGWCVCALASEGSGPGRHRGQPRCHPDQVTLPLAGPFAAPVSVDVSDSRCCWTPPCFPGIRWEPRQGRRGQAMNRIKTLRSGRGGLTTSGKGVATIGTPGRRDAGTPGRRDAPHCILALASSRVLCLPF